MLIKELPELPTYDTPISRMCQYPEQYVLDDMDERINGEDVWCDRCDDWGELHWHNDIKHDPRCSCSPSTFLHRVATEELKRRRLQLKISIQVLSRMLNEYEYECDALELDASLKAHDLIVRELQTRC